MRHGIVSIGFCIGRLDRVEVLRKGRFDLSPLAYVEQDEIVGPVALEKPSVNFQEFEERCLKDFWENEERFPGIAEKLKVMQKNAKDPIMEIIDFRNTIDDWDDRKNGWEAVLISDNVAFDARMINHYLSVAGLPSLNYDKTGTRYRPVVDTESFARGVERMDYSSLWVDDTALIQKYGLNASKADHTHMPEDDAEYIYRVHVGLVLKVAAKNE